MMIGPKYDGKVLNEVLMEGLGYTRIRDTLTNVVIPTYDIMLQQPIIFSTQEARVSYCVSSTCVHVFKIEFQFKFTFNL